MTIPLDQLPGFSGRRSKRVLVTAPGVLRDAVIQDWQVNVLSLERPDWPWWQPRWMVDENDVCLRFERCTFRRLRCHNFDPGPARFFDCVFEDVRLNFRPVLNAAHFVSCRFSGYIEANFGMESDPSDPSRKIKVHSNDFSDVDGPIDFLGTPEQRLDENGKHVVLRRGDRDAAQILELIGDERVAHDHTLPVWGPHAEWDWVLLSRWSFNSRPETWERVVAWRRASSAGDPPPPAPRVG